MRLPLLLLAGLALAVPTADAAGTAVFTDDAEAGPDAKWAVSTPTNPSIAPFQRSDATTPKLRGNQRVSGVRSFFVGVPLDKNHPVDVIEGQAAMTTKVPIAIPEGGAVLTYQSLFQNEGDDLGAVEVALASAPETFVRVDSVAAENTDITANDPAICSPTNPDLLRVPFSEREVDLKKFAGQEVLLRFVLEHGAENRVASQACGWYVDDVQVTAG